MMMKYLIVLCCALAAVVASEKYTSKYDNIDLQEILGNKRLLDAYVQCLLGKGKCTPEGNELKEHMEEAMTTGCEKCTEAQEEGTYTVIKHLIEHEPKYWEELTDKFDHEGVWRKKYEERAAAKGIKIPA